MDRYRCVISSLYCETQILLMLLRLVNFQKLLQIVMETGLILNDCKAAATSNCYLLDWVVHPWHEIFRVTVVEMIKSQLPVLVFSSRVDMLFSDSECEIKACTFEILSLNLRVISSFTIDFVNDVIVCLDVDLTTNTFEQLRRLFYNVFASPGVG